MELLDMAEEAGTMGRLSEDRIGLAGNLAWVIDGASDFLDERNLPAESNVHWLVDRVQEALHVHGSEGRLNSAAQILYAVQQEIVEDLATYDLRDMRQHPCCSIAIALDDGCRIELSRVGDATGFLYGKSIDLELSTKFFDQREAEAVATARSESLSREDIVTAMFQRRSEYIRGIAGESVFSGHPSGKLFIQTLVARRSGDAELIMLSTDGLTRAVSEYGLFPSWCALLEDCRDRGISNIIREVRRHETSLVDGTSGKFKRSDDIATILLKI
jgi:hypothetical protein